MLINVFMLGILLEIDYFIIGYFYFGCFGCYLLNLIVLMIFVKFLMYFRILVFDLIDI